MPDQTPQEEKKKRVAALRRLSDAKRMDFHRRMLGRVRPTLIENTPDKQTGLARGLTDNYISVLISDPPPPAGCILPVRLIEITPEGRVLGRLE